jgi:hypothetical protein
MCVSQERDAAQAPLSVQTDGPSGRDFRFAPTNLCTPLKPSGATRHKILLSGIPRQRRGKPDLLLTYNKKCVKLLTSRRL